MKYYPVARTAAHVVNIGIIEHLSSRTSRIVFASHVLDYSSHRHRRHQRWRVSATGRESVIGFHYASEDLATYRKSCNVPVFEGNSSSL
jgi:hypothetical protein